MIGARVVLEPNTAKKVSEALKDRARAKGLFRAVNSGMDTVIRPFVADVRAATPVESGQLRASIGKQKKTYSRSGVVHARIGPRWKFAFTAKGNNPRGYVNQYAGGIEYGKSKSGRITRKAGPAGMLRFAFANHVNRMRSTIEGRIQSAL